MNQAIVEVDARTLKCPLPILRLKKAVAGATSGNLVKMITADPGSIKDVEAYCRQTGNPLQSSEQEGGFFVFLVEKA